MTLVIRAEASEREITLFLLGPGDAFDVVSLLDQHPLCATNSSFRALRGCLHLDIALRLFANINLSERHESWFATWNHPSLGVYTNSVKSKHVPGSSPGRPRVEQHPASLRSPVQNFIALDGCVLAIMDRY